MILWQDPLLLIILLITPSLILVNYWRCFQKEQQVSAWCQWEQLCRKSTGPENTEAFMEVIEIQFWTV